MAGSFDIQRYPRGLVDLLGMKATGDAPHQLAPYSMLTLESLDLYLNERLTVLQAQTAIALNATGSFAVQNMQPPAGQLWFVYGVTLQSGTTAAATAIRLSLVCFRGLASSLPQALTDPVNLSANDAVTFGRTFETPMIMRPGDNIGVVVPTITGAPAIQPTVFLFYSPVGI